MRLLKPFTAILVLLALLAPAASAAGNHAKGARLDPSFGTGGKTIVRTPKFDWEEFAKDQIATVPSGASYALQGSGLNIYAFAPNGKPSKTFGRNGRVRLPIYAKSIAVDSQGRVLVAGTVQTGTDTPTGPTTLPPFEGSEAEILRYLPNGSPDPTFGTEGVVKTSFGTPLPGVVNPPPTTGTLPGPASSERPVVTLGELSVDGQDRPVVAGIYAERLGINCASNYVGFVARLATNGALDTSFGTGGHTIVQTGGAGGVSLAFAAAPASGFAVLVKQGPLNPCAGPGFVALSSLTSLNEAGATSPGFTPRGELQVAERLAVDPKGRILLVSTPSWEGPSTFAVTRLLPNGATDTSFGSGGNASLKPTGFESINGLAADPRGRIVVGGPNINTKKFQLARISAAGKLEPSFGTGSVLTIGFGKDVAGWLGGLAVDSKGRILAAGPVSGSGVKGGAAGLALTRILPGS